jgi:hypothetical protein
MSISSPPVTWDGLALNPLATRADGVLPVVENVTGWYDTPDYNGNDTPWVLADGAATGPKTANPRNIVISGSVIGPPGELATFRDLLVVRAAARSAASLSITDAAGRLMTASVRCDSDGLKHTFLAPDLFSYQATLTANDPRLYGTAITVVLSNFAPGLTGWTYPGGNPRAYKRQYAATVLPNQAVLGNAGNVGAPVTATYLGDLGASRLVDDSTGNTIYLAPVAIGATVTLDTETLTASAPGGASRASLVLPGSVPLLVPPLSSASWSLYATGSGSVSLTWSPAWH